MKRLLSKKNLLGSAGLSLLELIVSMAILATVAIAIGGAMYVTSRSYSQNSAEINVQEEAQVASNLICDWLIDAQEVTPDDGNDTELVIKHWENGELVTVKVFRAGSELKYEAKNSSGTVIGSGVLANNVTGVSFSSKFKDNRNVRISIDFDINDRTYHSVTDSTSRNHDFIADVNGTDKSAPIIVFDIPPTRDADHFEVFLEPGQNVSQLAEYLFHATVYNYDANTTFTVTGPDGVVGSSATAGNTTVAIGNNGGTNVFPITSTTTDTAKSEGTYTFTATKPIYDPNTHALVDTLIDTKFVDVKIRRATECSFKDAPSSTGNNVEELTAAETGTHATVGAVYPTVYVYLGDQTYPRVAGATYDNYFVESSTVKFEYRLSDGTDAYTEYIDETKTVEVTSGQPSVKVVLKKSLPAGKDLYVVAVSTHQGDTSVSTSFGNIGATGDNKLRHTYGPTDNGVTGWNYYDSTNQGVTWDAFKITAPEANNTPDPFNFADLGICRNTPSFEMGHVKDSYLTWLRNYITRTTGKDPSDAQYGFKFYTCIQYEEISYDIVNNPSGSPLANGYYELKYGKYTLSADVSVVPGKTYYKPKDHDWDALPEYVLYKTSGWGDLCHHQNTQSWSHENGRCEGFFFELDKAYDINVEFYVYDNNNDYVYMSHSVGSIPAAVPHIYDPWNAYNCFTENAYDGTTVTYTDSNGNEVTERRVYNHDHSSQMSFYVYFDSVCLANNRLLSVHFYEWIGPVSLSSASDAQKADTNNWRDVTSSFNGKYQLFNCENPSQAAGVSTGSVRIPSGPGVSNPYYEYTIKGYNENYYAENVNDANCGANVEEIRIFSYTPFMANKDYRISFETSYPYVKTSDINYGSYGGDFNSATPGSSHITNKDYTISNTNANTGFIYVHGV